MMSNHANMQDNGCGHDNDIILFNVHTKETTEDVRGGDCGPTRLGREWGGSGGSVDKT